MRNLIIIALLSLLLTGCFKIDNSVSDSFFSDDGSVIESEVSLKPSFNIGKDIEIVKEYDDAAIVRRKTDQQYGVVSLNGDMAVDFAPYYMDTYKDGLVIARIGETYGEYLYGVYCNPSDQWADRWLVKPKYNKIHFGTQYIEVELNEMEGAFLYDGSFVIDGEKYKSFQLRNDGYVKVRLGTGEPDSTVNVEDEDKSISEVPLHNKWGIITMTGEVVVKPEYDSIEERADGYSLAMQDGKYGYFDELWNLVIPFQFTGAEPFSEGRAIVDLGEGFYRILDKEGKSTPYPQYDRLSSYHSGISVAIWDETEYNGPTFMGRYPGPHLRSYRFAYLDLDGNVLYKSDFNYGYIVDQQGWMDPEKIAIDGNYPIFKVADSDIVTLDVSDEFEYALRYGNSDKILQLVLYRDDLPRKYMRAELSKEVVITEKDFDLDQVEMKTITLEDDWKLCLASYDWPPSTKHYVSRSTFLFQLYDPHMNPYGSSIVVNFDDYFMETNFLNTLKFTNNSGEDKAITMSTSELGRQLLYDLNFDTGGYHTTYLYTNDSLGELISVSENGNLEVYHASEFSIGGAYASCDEVIRNTLKYEMHFLCKGYAAMSFGKGNEILVADAYNHLRIYDAMTGEIIIPAFTLGDNKIVVNGITADHANNLYLVAVTLDVRGSDGFPEESRVFIYILDSQGNIQNIIETAATGVPFHGPSFSRQHIPIEVDGYGYATIKLGESQDRVPYIE